MDRQIIASGPLSPRGFVREGVMSIDRVTAALKDRYRVERELGAGGMATVYLAEDLKHRRKVAVKVRRPEPAAAIGPERFLREIEIAANLTHPHILSLHDSGEAGGFLYYVMPYIDGESFARSTGARRTTVGRRRPRDRETSCPRIEVRA
jgi:serine/threonine-protein kinase